MTTNTTIEKINSTTTEQKIQKFCDRNTIKVVCAAVSRFDSIDSFMTSASEEVARCRLRLCCVLFLASKKLILFHWFYFNSFVLNKNGVRTR